MRLCIFNLMHSLFLSYQRLMNKPHSHKTKKSLVEPSPRALAERWKPYWPRMSLHLAEAASLCFPKDRSCDPVGFAHTLKQLPPTNSLQIEFLGSMELSTLTK